MNLTDLLHSPTAAAAVLGLFALLSAWHIGRKAAQLVPAKPLELHTGHAWLDQGAAWLSSCVEDVLRSALQGDVLDNVLAALAAGNPAEAERVLFGAVPGLLGTVKAHLGDFGPALEAFLTATGLDDKIRKVVLARLPAVAAEHGETLKTIKTLADGRKVVELASPLPPA